jgi:hypothetical protein
VAEIMTGMGVEREVMEEKKKQRFQRRKEK